MFRRTLLTQRSNIWLQFLHVFNDFLFYFHSLKPLEFILEYGVKEGANFISF